MVAAYVAEGAWLMAPVRSTSGRGRLLHWLLQHHCIDAVVAGLRVESSSTPPLDFTLDDGDHGETVLHLIAGATPLVAHDAVCRVLAAVVHHLQTHPLASVEWGQKNFFGQDFLALAAAHQKLSLVLPLISRVPAFEDRMEPLVLDAAEIVWRWDAEAAAGAEDGMPFEVGLGVRWIECSRATGRLTRLVTAVVEDPILGSAVASFDPVSRKHDERGNEDDNNHNGAVGMTARDVDEACDRALNSLPPWLTDEFAACIAAGGDVTFSPPFFDEPLLQRLVRHGCLPLVRLCLTTPHRLDFTRRVFALASRSVEEAAGEGLRQHEEEGEEEEEIQVERDDPSWWDALFSPVQREVVSAVVRRRRWEESRERRVRHGVDDGPTPPSPFLESRENVLEEEGLGEELSERKLAALLHLCLDRLGHPREGADSSGTRTTPVSGAVAHPSQPRDRWDWMAKQSIRRRFIFAGWRHVGVGHFLDFAVLRGRLGVVWAILIARRVPEFFRLVTHVHRRRSSSEVPGPLAMGNTPASVPFMAETTVGEARGEVLMRRPMTASEMDHPLDGEPSACNAVRKDDKDECEQEVENIGGVGCRPHITMEATGGEKPITRTCCPRAGDRYRRLSGGEPNKSEVEEVLPTLSLSFAVQRSDWARIPQDHQKHFLLLSGME